MISFLEFIGKMNESFHYDEDFDNGPLHDTLAQRMSRDSALQNHKIGNVDVVATHHAAARATQRQGDKTPADWHQFSKNIVSFMKSRGSNTPDKEYLIKSKSLGHSVVANLRYDGDKKQIRYMTVLPGDKSLPKNGTQKLVIESVELEELEIE